MKHGTLKIHSTEWVTFKKNKHIDISQSKDGGVGAVCGQQCVERRGLSSWIKWRRARQKRGAESVQQFGK